jgi:hypothetical protein
MTIVVDIVLLLNSVLAIKSLLIGAGSSVAGCSCSTETASPATSPRSRCRRWEARRVSVLT